MAITVRSFGVPIAHCMLTYILFRWLYDYSPIWRTIHHCHLIVCMPDPWIPLWPTWGPSIKYVMLFLDNFDPSLCHTSQDFPKVCHTSRTPRFLVGLVKNNGQKPSVQILSVVRGGLVRGFCQGVLCLEGFCPFPLLSEYICYKRKLNITLNFKFHMYDKNLKVWRHMFSTPPSPVTNCHTFSDPLTLEHDILYGLPLCCFPTHF